MSLPFFYTHDLNAAVIILDEDTSKHVVQVLRMKAGERLLLTDGKGTKAEGIIINNYKKRCEITIESLAREDRKTQSVCISISLLKNSSRFELFLEKATEIGVAEIIPMICERTEKQKFRFDRFTQILNSAMLQSQQCWLPILREPVTFKQVTEEGDYTAKLIAHCAEAEKTNLLSKVLSSPKDHRSSIILIGPEGDFTDQEIELALQKGFQPVTLGTTRLRTETAGLVAAALLGNVVSDR